jgi:hypothetical protein
MRKSQFLPVDSPEIASSKGRVLARVLAEELGNVVVGGGAGPTTVATDPGHPGGNKDITNWTYDNDGFEY